MPTLIIPITVDKKTLENEQKAQLRVNKFLTRFNELNKTTARIKSYDIGYMGDDYSNHVGTITVYLNID